MQHSMTLRLWIEEKISIVLDDRAQIRIAISVCQLYTKCLFDRVITTDAAPRLELVSPALSYV